MTDRSVLVRLRANASQYNRELVRAAATTKAFSRELDASNNQTSMLVQSLLAVGPALVPLGGAGAVALSSFASSLGFTAGAAGSAALAFGGIGDSLQALNEYQLDPTIENLAKVREEFDKISPAGQEFVAFLQDLRPQLQGLQDAAQENMFPGMQEGIESALEQLPVFERIVAGTSEALGNITRDAGEALNNPFWTEFLNFIEVEAGPSIETFFRSLGNVTEGLAGMWMAMEPLNNDFSEAMQQATEDFARWADAIDETEGFESFVDYVREHGPQVWDTLGALGSAFVELTEAAAPLGGPTLEILQSFAAVISLIANSPAGTVLIGYAAGVAAVSRAVALFNIANASAISQFIGVTGEDGKKAIPAMRGISAAVGVLALSLTDLDDKLGVSNTAMGAMMGMVAGPWGAAIGAGVGAVIDLAAANDDLEASLRSANTAMSNMDIGQMREAITELGTEIGEFSWGNLVHGLDDQRAEDKIAALEQEIRELEGGVGGVADLFGDALGPAVNTTSEAFSMAALAADDFRDSLEDVHAVLEGRSAFRQYEEAIDEAAAIFTERADIMSQIAEAEADLAGADTKSEREAAREEIARLQEELGNLAVTLDITTEAGRENEERLDAIAVSALKVAEGLEGMDRVNFLRNARREFIDAAVDLGMTRDAARELATELGLLDTKKPEVEVKSRGIGKVKRDLDDVRNRANRLEDPVSVWVGLEDHASENLAWIDALIGDLDGKRVDIKVNAKSSTGSDLGDLLSPNAAGNLYSAHAAGDVANGHQPAIAPGSKHVRIWAEEETGGESYIPHANDWRRPRAVKIWEETGRILGVNLRKFAAGDVVPRYTPQPMYAGGAGVPAIDYDRLSQAVLSARQLYGDVHVYGDGSFRREVTKDSVRHAGGGVTF